MRPKALDLCCKAGGVSMGLYRAGFDVRGVDIQPQPNYPFWFMRADALAFDMAGFDFIWASPPCQANSRLRHLQNGKEYANIIIPMRARLRAAGVPYVIENVVGADLVNPIQLCGSSFGLGVWRHRLFECSFPILTPECNHATVPKPIDVTGTGGPFKGIRKSPGGGISRKPDNLQHASEVMGIDWMTRAELSQAIPPAFSEYIGRHAIRHVQAKVA